MLFSKKDGAEETLSRREILTLTVGGITYAKVAASALTKINRGDAYPEEHENRVSDAFERSILEAHLSSNRDVNTPLRILEIGIGTSCRTVIRGLYDKAFKKLALFSEKTTKPGIEFIGLDVDATPTKAFETARMKLMTSFPNLSISFGVIQGDIVGGLVFPDGYFDVITCSFVLCSVSDQKVAVEEIKRLLKPGGCFGWVEHVNVDLEEDAPANLVIFDMEQKLFDPLQQIVAHNCHLRRETDHIIRDIFEQDADFLECDRFFIPDMWPVSCQASGVLKVRNNLI